MSPFLPFWLEGGVVLMLHPPLCLVQLRLRRSHQVIRKYVFSVLPLPAFDFFRERHKALSSLTSASSQRKKSVYLKYRRRWNEELLHPIPKAFESSQKLLCSFCQRLCLGWRKKKLICLNEWNNWAMPVTVYTHAKLLQFCPTLCHPVDIHPTGSPVHGMSQAKILFSFFLT